MNPAARELAKADWKIHEQASKLGNRELQTVIDENLALISMGLLHGTALEGAKVLATAYARILLRRQGKEV